MTGSIRGNKDAPAPGGVRLFGAHQTILPEELPDLLSLCGRDAGAQLPEGHAKVTKGYVVSCLCMRCVMAAAVLCLPVVQGGRHVLPTCMDASDVSPAIFSC